MNIYLAALKQILTNNFSGDFHIHYGHDYCLCLSIENLNVMIKDPKCTTRTPWRTLRHDEVAFCKALVFAHDPNFNEEVFQLQQELQT